MTDFLLDDLDTIDAAEAGVTVDLFKLDGMTPLRNALGEQVQLVLHGSDSKVYRDASRAMARMRVERAQENKVALGSDKSLDMMEADQIELLARCTSGWHGIIDSKSKPVPFTKQAAIDFYGRYPAAREQAEKAIMNRALFTKASSGA